MNPALPHFAQALEYVEALLQRPDAHAQYLRCRAAAARARTRDAHGSAAGQPPGQKAARLMAGAAAAPPGGAAPCDAELAPGAAPVPLELAWR